MWTYPNFDPVALDLGFIQIHWYGLMYLFGISGAWLLMNRMNRPDGLYASLFSKEQVADMAFYCMLGVVIGGRLGYTLFYDFGTYLSNPLAIFQVWKGGMSFHGGLIGVCFAMCYSARKFNIPLFQLSDMIAPLVPIGLGLGRLGNFINGELWGKVTDSPFGMLVWDEASKAVVQKYPTQLLEALLEGLLLFVILMLVVYKKPPRYTLTGLFGFCYGCFRFFAEFFREPDAHIGYLAFDWLTMGQVLSMPMIFLGGYLLYLAYSKQIYPNYASNAQKRIQAEKATKQSDNKNTSTGKTSKKKRSKK